MIRISFWAALMFWVASVFAAFEAGVVHADFVSLTEYLNARYAAAPQPKEPSE